MQFAEEENFIQHLFIVYQSNGIQSPQAESLLQFSVKMSFFWAVLYIFLSPLHLPYLIIFGILNVKLWMFLLQQFFLLHLKRYVFAFFWKGNSNIWWLIL